MAWVAMPSCALASDAGPLTNSIASTSAAQVVGGASATYGLTAVLSSPVLIALISGLMAGGFTLAATRRSTDASRSLERHKFRYEIGRMAAEKRLAAYVMLAAMVSEAYRKKTTLDWALKEWVVPLNDAKNYYYDNRFYFSRELGAAFRDVSKSLQAEYPKKEVLELNLNSFFHVVRSDLLLADLEESAQRAVKAAVAMPDEG